MCTIFTRYYYKLRNNAERELYAEYDSYLKFNFKHKKQAGEIAISDLHIDA